ncbi:MAG: VanW family protein [Faecousia sp.]
MKRKLFCELGPVAYQISEIKETALRRMRDLRHGVRFARTHQQEPLPCLWKGDDKIIRRQLHGVDMRLQENKAVNLRLAGSRIDGLVIRPGETFSFYETVGKTTAKKGYLEGLVINNHGVTSGIGGGMCQLANLIHYMVLHSPLEVTELHHHTDALFPDSGRRVPFGTGTSVSYKKLDYRFYNGTDTPVQLRVWQDETTLYGELRGTQPLPVRYRLEEEDNHFAKDADGCYYRNSRVYRVSEDVQTGEELARELVLANHSKVMYDYDLIPKEQIRQPV